MIKKILKYLKRILENKTTLEEYTEEVLKIFDKKLMEWNWI